MTMVFNTGLGMLGFYQGLPAANDALIVVPLLAAGLEAEATMRDHATLAAVLAGSSNENTTVGGRVTLSGLTTEVDNANNRRDFDSADIVFPAEPGSTGPVGALLICYDPDTTGGDDTTIIPLTKHDVTWSPDGNQMTFTVNDWAQSSNPA